MSGVAPPAPGCLVDIGGTPMHAVVDGIGGPAVILESGLGGSVLEWGTVAAALSRHTTVVRRDRPGLGWSEHVDRDRTATAAADDLWRLLQALEVPPPYLLVGHSLGGFHIRALAAAHPDEVAGVVFVDASHEDFFEKETAQNRLNGVMRGIMRAGIALGPVGGASLVRGLYLQAAKRDLTKPVRADAEQALQALEAVHRASRGWMHAILAESKALDASCAQMHELRRAGTFPTVPVRVITQGRPAPKPKLEPLGERWRGVYQADFVTLGVDGQQVFAERSGHLIPLDQPEIIIEAVEGLLGVAPSAVEPLDG